MKRREHSRNVKLSDHTGQTFASWGARNQKSGVCVFRCISF